MRPSRVVRAANSPAGIVLFNLTAVAALALPARFRPTNRVRAVGGIAALTGAVLGLLGLRRLGRNYSREVRIQSEQELVTSGPYSRIRHPLYTANFLIYLGISLLLGSVSGLVALVALVIPRFLLVTGYEERLLEQQFGDEYRGWAFRTGRFFPRL